MMNKQYIAFEKQRLIHPTWLNQMFQWGIYTIIMAILCLLFQMDYVLLLILSALMLAEVITDGFAYIHLYSDKLVLFDCSYGFPLKRTIPLKEITEISTHQRYTVVGTISEVRLRTKSRKTVVVSAQDSQAFLSEIRKKRDQQ